MTEVADCVGTVSGGTHVVTEAIVRVVVGEQGGARPEFHAEVTHFDVQGRSCTRKGTSAVVEAENQVNGLTNRKRTHTDHNVGVGHVG